MPAAMPAAVPAVSAAICCPSTVNSMVSRCPAIARLLALAHQDLRATLSDICDNNKIMASAGSAGGGPGRNGRAWEGRAWEWAVTDRGAGEGAAGGVAGDQGQGAVAVAVVDRVDDLGVRGV